MSEEKRCCPVNTTASKSTYVPQGDAVYITGPLDAKAGIILIGDIFGMHANTKRTADDLGKAGYLVAMPDFFGADAWEESNYPPASFEDPAWLKFYKFITDLDLHLPKALRAIAMLRKMGCEKVAALGLCWGAVATMRLSADSSVDAASVAHPSFVNGSSVNAIKTPLCILAAIDDKDTDSLKAAAEALTTQPTVFRQYTHLHHGFFGARFDFDGAAEEPRSERAEAFQTLLRYYAEFLH